MTRLDLGCFDDRFDDERLDDWVGEEFAGHLFSGSFGSIRFGGAQADAVMLAGADSFYSGIAETLQPAADRFALRVVDPGLRHDKYIDLPERLFGVRWNLLSENRCVTDQAFKCLDIPQLSASDDVIGQDRGRRLMIPAGG